MLLGLCGVLVGERLGMAWLKSADAVAALGVAMIVVWISIKLGKKSVDDLLDSVPTRIAGASGRRRPSAFPASSN